MARRPIPSLAADFAQVLAFLQKRHIVASPAQPELVATARKIHEATYSLILWKFRLRRLSPHGRVFTDEIASDALQILPQILMGYDKTAKLLIRGIIENTLRHIYFSDHPIEFGRMNRDAKWYLTAEDLFDYAKHHPDFLKSERQFDALSRLSSLYSDLSAGIHGRSVRDLEMRVALSKIEYAKSAARKEADFASSCAESANFLLAIFHRQRMSRFQREDQRIILRTMPAKARAIWKNFD